MADFILPEPLPSPLEDPVLTDAIQATVAGVTGLAGQWVRPRWQPEPPNQPDFSVNWAAVGITGFDDELYTYEKQIDEATRQLERSQDLTMLVSFYGPLANRYAGIFKDGIMIEANRFALGAVGLKLKEVQRSRNLPALVKEKYLNRIDVPVILSRRIIRTYKLNSINQAWVGLDNEYYITPIIVNPPSS